MFERFTDRARRVLVLAQEEARLLDHNFIGTEHILLGLLHEGDGIGARALRSLGVHLGAVRERVEETIGPAGSASTGSPPFTPRAKKVLELSLREALQLGHNYIGTEHLLLGLVREGEGVAVQVMVALGADLARVRQQVIQLLSGYQRGGEADEPLMASRSGWAPRPSGPRCPSCWGLLEGDVAYRVLTVPAAEPGLDVGPLPVAFVYCRRCGVTIAHTPTDPDHPALTAPTVAPLVAASGPIHRPPPAPNRHFPDEMWNASPPTTVSPAGIVDVLHSGHFHEDGSLRGTVAGSAIDLTLDLPHSTSSATGTLDDRPVNVTWTLSYDETTELGLPAELHGTVGAKEVNLRGLFTHTDSYFDRASVQGTLDDTDLAASIERTSGAYGSTDTVVATGTFGGRPFEIFAALGGSLERGRVRGTYNGQTVHLDLTGTPGADTHVTGSCPSPPSFALVLVGSLLFFV